MNPIDIETLSGLPHLIRPQSNPTPNATKRKMNQQSTPARINRTAPIRLTEGAIVEAADGAFGEIVDPIRRQATHLVVSVYGPYADRDKAALLTALANPSHRS